MRHARLVLAGVAMLPFAAIAQSGGGQSLPDLGGFNLPPKPKPTPTPPPSGPIIAPLARPTPVPAPAPTPAPVATVTPPPVTSTTGPRTAPATARPAPQAGATPPAVATGTPQPAASATSGAPAPATALPNAQPTSAPVPAAVPSNGSSGLWIAIAMGVVALLGSAFFLFGRRRKAVTEDDQLELTELAPEPVAAPPLPSSHLTVPIRRSSLGTGIGAVPEPDIEIVLIPRRAGTNLMSAAVDYRVLVRNNGKGEARDVRFGIYLFSASARQAADLQMIFASQVEKPVVAPFTLVPGQEVELSGMAMLPRDNVNVMTIDGKPWFVPVMAMKAEYRWGENVGTAGVATAAHMIGIDRGEGVKMSPFRFDGGPMMHPEVAERKVA